MEQICTFGQEADFYLGLPEEGEEIQYSGQQSFDDSEQNRMKKSEKSQISPPPVKIYYAEDDIDYQYDANGQIGPADNKSLCEIMEIKPLDDSRNEKTPRRKYMIMMVVFVLLSIVLIIVASVARQSNKGEKSSTKQIEENCEEKSEETSPPSKAWTQPSPTSVPVVQSDRYSIFRKILSDLSSGDCLFSDESSPQFLALEWLVYNDLSALEVENSTINELSERYIMALLYFATTGDNWTWEYRFLSDTSICEWNFVDQNDNTGGVFCDANGSISDINIGTLCAPWL